MFIWQPTPFIPLPYKGRGKNIRREATPLFNSLSIPVTSKERGEETLERGFALSYLHSPFPY